METNSEKFKAPIGLMILCLALIWGFSLVAMALLMEKLTPVEILAVRWTIAALFFLGMVAAGKFKINFRTDHAKYLFFTGLSEPCIYALFETYAVQKTTPSLSAIFIAIIPCVEMLLEVVVYKRKMTGLGILSVFIALTGVLICTVFGPSFSLGGELIGIILLIGLAISGGSHGLFTGKATEKYDPYQVTAVMSFMAAIWFNALNLITGHGIDTYITVLSSWKLIAGELFLGIGCSVICFVLLSTVISRIDTTMAYNLIGSSVTIVGVIAGILVTHDPWGLHTVIGAIITLVGVWLSSRVAKSAEPKIKT